MNAPDGVPTTCGCEPGGCGTPSMTLVDWATAASTITSVGSKIGPPSASGRRRIARSVIFTSSGSTVPYLSAMPGSPAFWPAKPPNGASANVAICGPAICGVAICGFLIVAICGTAAAGTGMFASTCDLRSPRPARSPAPSA